ncbi:MAG: riboflavin kinase [Tidjanibacter sp.]|nr:riboflavin kinase [Tidjanibacter sp.]
MCKTIIKGRVAEGRKIGRKLGFPTANISIDGGVKLRDGVYAGLAHIDNTRHKAVINVGCNPSVKENGDRRVEVHLLDFDKDIYGLEIEIEFLYYLREECKFPSLEALAEQIGKDKATANRLLDEYTKQ